LSLSLPLSHNWNLDPKDAISLQRELAQQVDTKTPIDVNAISTVAGVDVSVKNDVSRAAVVVLSFPDLTLVEAVSASMPTPFPYITGLLSFREGAVILAAHAKLKSKPDVYIFDGMGIMHPRRLGIASHMGLWFDAPTVGCGKSYLIGDYMEPSLEEGSSELVTHKGDTLGVVLRTRTNVKPVFISPGHKATIESAQELVLRCVTKYRLPEPIRAAHNTAGQF